MAYGGRKSKHIFLSNLGFHKNKLEMYESKVMWASVLKAQRLVY